MLLYATLYVQCQCQYTQTALSRDFFLPNAVSILPVSERSRPCLKYWLDTQIHGSLEKLFPDALCLSADEAAAASASHISGVGAQNKETSPPFIKLIFI